MSYLAPILLPDAGTPVAVNLTQMPTSNGNLAYSFSTAFPSSLYPIRKRKVKFTIQLTIQELLSVPYLNGVLFCKIRLCDGGHYVSYSSKKEVSNSSVLWSNDSPIQFEVKTTQYYQITQNSASPVQEIATAPGSFSNGNTTNGQNSFFITGYEPCLCRISVRKELRGGKSYQKLGYVDYNLTDFIFKYQKEQNQLLQIKSSTNDEFCINRILKEYESSKKNQQRLDNSYLKIKIKVIDTSTKQNIANNVCQEEENKASSPCDSPQHKKMSSDSTDSQPKHNELIKLKSSPSVTVQSAALNSLPETGEATKFNPNSPIAPTGTHFTPSHSRNSSLSTTNSVLSTTAAPYTQPAATFVNGHYSIDLSPLSYSNGSIKSNVSFDFLIKNRTKKFLEDVHSSSSSTSFLNNNNNNSNQAISSVGGSNGQLLSPHQAEQSNLNFKSSVFTSSATKIEPGSNLHIIETRIDANEIINQIETELSNRLNNLKSTNK